MSYIKILFITLSLTMLVGACAQKKPTSYEQVKLEEAKKDCLQQAQSMENRTINMADAKDNSYFSMCMQTKYGYTWEQVQKMGW